MQSVGKSANNNEVPHYAEKSITPIDKSCG